MPYSSDMPFMPAPASNMETFRQSLPSTTTGWTEGSFSSWSAAISSSLARLKQIAGTEMEFLQIGNDLQEIYQCSLTLTQTAHKLVETASGERLQELSDRLRDLFREMNTYLDETRTRNLAGFTTLKTVADLLKRIEDPLAGVRKMCKHLYILEVSIKIESAYLGDLGGEFVNLAMDIKQLSQQTKEKTFAIEAHRSNLKTIIDESGNELAKARKDEEAEAGAILAKTAASLEEMVAASTNFSQLGAVISENSRNCTENISTIVQSMQFHDIFRQQVEHVISGLEGLLPVLPPDHSSPVPDDDRQAAISKTGDVCELQEAQLQYASAALYDAVASIVGGLRAIGGIQKEMSRDVINRTGGAKRRKRNGSSSFIAEVSSQMHAITDLLAASGASNRQISDAMQEITGTVRQITGFVTDIEAIGQDIIQIALNARIKAATTGDKGDSLSALAAEIGQMSEEAVQRTDTISTTLTEIDGITEVLSAETSANQENLATRLVEMDGELGFVLDGLDAIGRELVDLLGRISNQAQALAAAIDGLTNSIKVHMHIKDLADKVLAELREIIAESRRLHPASADFLEDLRQMAQRYTMESERRIHEKIAGKHGVETAEDDAAEPAAVAGESEFGDNVDLF